MVRVFQSTGGIVSGDELSSLLRERVVQPISAIARSIVHRKVVNFPWHGVTLLPLFQFDLTTIAVRCNAALIISELSPAFDDWELAAWFAQPNSWLHGRTPVALLDTDLPAVLDAARADRFVAMG